MLYCELTNELFLVISTPKYLNNPKPNRTNLLFHHHLMLKNILFVGIGSFFGGALRYLVYRLCDHIQLHSSLATLAVNIVGCALLGCICGSLDRGGSLNEQVRLFLVFGICGGFTTFSTFINDGFKLLRGGASIEALCYTLASLILGLGALYLGYWLLCRPK